MRCNSVPVRFSFQFRFLSRFRFRFRVRLHFHFRFSQNELISLVAILPTNVEEVGPLPHPRVSYMTSICYSKLSIFDDCYQKLSTDERLEMN